MFHYRGAASRPAPRAKLVPEVRRSTHALRVHGEKHCSCHNARQQGQLLKLCCGSSLFVSIWTLGPVRAYSGRTRSVGVGPVTAFTRPIGMYMSCARDCRRQACRTRGKLPSTARPSPSTFPHLLGACKCTPARCFSHCTQDSALDVSDVIPLTATSFSRWTGCYSMPTQY